MNLFNVLLTLHIIAGSLALGSAFVAILTKTFNASHKWHIYSGNLYVLGMIIIFLTAVPMTILHPNLFLFFDCNSQPLSWHGRLAICEKPEGDSK